MGERVVRQDPRNAGTRRSRHSSRDSPRSAQAAQGGHPVLPGAREARLDGDPVDTVLGPPRESCTVPSRALLQPALLRVRRRDTVPEV